MLRSPSLNDLWSLVALCALVFIPLGALLAPRLPAIGRRLRWILTGRRRIRHVRSLEAALDKEDHA
ncbi:cellulose biosynthesis protein BcsF [Sutterella sp.]|uniref:cellulose biosynthesis protein BcsF n=1 Tax=Sutterella sp. TaxID=1981025 RepID=UPI0026E0BB20|nr:cellulose biosynthesis protein BcsF [Sutterella sp.]MDO5532799.1 cellulose biosynthesis protein BcsF [Sutterella sp.]